MGEGERGRGRGERQGGEELWKIASDSSMAYQQPQGVPLSGLSTTHHQLIRQMGATTKTRQMGYCGL